MLSSLILFTCLLQTLSALPNPKLPREWDQPRALYYITNDAQNAVVSLNVADDGSLSEGSMILTGGAGSHALNATGQVSGGDALYSEGSIKVVGQVRMLP